MPDRISIPLLFMVPLFRPLPCGPKAVELRMAEPLCWQDVPGWQSTLGVCQNISFTTCQPSYAIICSMPPPRID